MKGKDELEGTRSNFTPWLAILSTRAKTVRGVGTTPLGELGLIQSHNNIVFLRMIN